MKSMVKLFAIIAFAAIVGFTFAACDNGTTREPVDVTGVTLNETVLGVVKGTTRDDLIATVEPANATNRRVTWASNDEAIATVSSTGAVTGVAEGTTRITVTTVDGGFSDFADVHVTLAPVYVTEVTLSPPAPSLFVGDTEELTATINPPEATNRRVTWSSSNEAIATVSPTTGLVTTVTAVAVGSTTITVTTECGSRTATASVTVNPRPVTRVELDYDRVDLRRGHGRPNGIGAEPTIFVGETRQLKNVVITPAYATNQSVNWGSNDEAIATVSSTGEVTAVAVGRARITVTTVDGGFSDFVYVYVHSLAFNHYTSTNTIHILGMSVGISGTVKDLVIPETIYNNAPVVQISGTLFRDRNLRSLVIPANVTIASGVFQGNDNLTSITIGANVTLPVHDPPTLWCTFPLGGLGGISVLSSLYQNNGRVAGTFERHLPHGEWRWYPLNP